MKKVALWGLVGMVMASAIAMPAQAQLQGLSKAAGKLAERITGKEVSPSTIVSDTAVGPAVGAEKSARVTVLDKQTNRRQTIVLMAGEAQTVATIQVKLTKCTPDFGAVLGQDVAWLDVTEGADGNGRTAPWFSGWMFNTYPEVSTLDHPRYDVQLQGCGAKARQVIKATGSAPVLDSAAPAVDTETPNDAPAVDGADPYYVPGVDKGANDGATNAAPAAVEQPTAVAPAETVEVPAAAMPVEQPAAPTDGGQQDLHKMMDSGTY